MIHFVYMDDCGNTKTIEMKKNNAPSKIAEAAECIAYAIMSNPTLIAIVEE